MRKPHQPILGDEQEPILSALELTKTFPTSQGAFGLKKARLKAVANVDLRLRRGRTLGLVGESGCGKSTLGKLLVGLLEADSGTIRFHGHDLWGKDRKADQKHRRNIQMIFQDPFSSLNPRRTIGATIEEGLIIHGMKDAKKRRDKVAEMLIRVGLKDNFFHRYPHEFSGGQRQRIAIARTLILKPEVVVCDEPVSALDVSVQAQIMNLLKALQETLDLSYLFISHDLSVVKTMADRVAVMYLGRIVEQADKADLYHRPAHPYTQALLAAVPVPDPTHLKRPILLPGETPSPVNPPPGCTFHPRCPHRMDICSIKAPAWTEIAPQHRVRCFLHGEAEEPS